MNFYENFRRLHKVQNTENPHIKGLKKYNSPHLFVNTKGYSYFLTAIQNRPTTTTVSQKNNKLTEL